MLRSLIGRAAGWYRRVPAEDETLGARGERWAERYLRRRGYRIVEKSSRSKLGEIDLVAVHRGTVVFVEVKTRRSDVTGHPVEAVHAEKQRRLTRLALAYLKRQDLLEAPARFDIVALTWPVGSRHPQIEHYQDAFDAAGKWQMYS